MSPSIRTSDHDASSTSNQVATAVAHSKKTTTKSLKLISVSFKEAALDSPTFRASMNHLNNQIEKFEQWLDGLLKLASKYPQRFQEFKEFLNVVLDQLRANFLNDGLVDQDYTMPMLVYTSIGLKESLEEIFKLFGVTNDIEALLMNVLKKDIKPYKDLRKIYETIQNKYDLFLSRYNSQPKTKEPSALREDAFQLSEIRKQYIHVCLDISVAISNLSKNINFMLVDLSDLIWKENINVNVHTKQSDQFRFKTKRIKMFYKSFDFSVKTLSKDMDASRKQTEESTIKQFEPSRQLSDHDSTLINSSTLLDNFSEVTYEKHGWLFMKTSTGKPVRQVWVRRWVFIKDGIFGLLVLSPSKTFVQETDKIGVLLCNIRYCPDEERRFCFELKTIESSIIFQAETLYELKSWLKCFKVVKEKILSEQTQANGNDDSAFGRYPPLLNEFASTANTSIDMELTTINQENSMSSIIQNHLSQYVTKDSEFLTDGLTARILLNTPTVTQLTKEAVVSNSFLSPTTIPSAITANIWGSVNWGMYYLLNEPEAIPSKETQQKWLIEPKKSFSERYPSYYPNYLKPFDVQLKSLFESVVVPNEHLLLEFRSIWLPNSKQELSGRCFVTEKNVYFYMNSMNFISLLFKPLSEIVSFESYEDEFCDVLKVYEISGLTIRAKLFLDSGKLIKDQFSALIKNKILEPSKQKNLKELIEEFENIRISHELQEKERNENSFKERHKKIIPSFVKSIDDDSQVQMKTNYKNEMTLIWDKIYEIPSKALFHFLLGDDSFVLQKILPFIDMRNENIPMSLWRLNKNTHHLLRSFKTDTILDDYEFQTTIINQTIEDVINSKYYNIIQETQFFKFPCSTAFKVQTRIVIYSLNVKNCKLLIYTKVDYLGDNKNFNFICKCINFVNNKIMIATSRIKTEKKLDKDINEAIRIIGSHGKVVKAIRLFGQISQVDDETNPGLADKIQRERKNQDLIYVRWSVVAGASLRKSLSTFFYIVKTLFIILLSLFTTFLKGIRLHWVLVMLLGLSTFYNVYISVRTTTSYWTVREVGKMMDQYTLQRTSNIMQRAIYLKDIEDLISNGETMSYNNSESQCFHKFKNNSFILNLNENFVNDDNTNSQKHNQMQAAAPDNSYKTIENLKKTFIELGLKRNELLVNLKIINKAEEELAYGEWKNWILNEVKRCHFVKDEILGNTAALKDDAVREMLANTESLIEYCNSCDQELQHSYLLGTAGGRAPAASV
ncbi:hypothetical protein PACTADRAFT_49928 [Pachysolen tannophilus NRRL Y-2460]|uniref:Uncharacterized protein n=1 Tax=Pachysolen tannophilus NRRL Y-2460 TaxID=669874 RepID=A0A1E4TTX6_PACTA|nr:hypothetical protein PACTADRAFT_49928 [Pachysolen tannophilus NRRL Y-2460]